MAFRRNTNRGSTYSIFTIFPGENPDDEVSAVVEGLRRSDSLSIVEKVKMHWEGKDALRICCRAAAHSAWIFPGPFRPRYQNKDFRPTPKLQRVVSLCSLQKG